MYLEDYMMCNTFTKCSEIGTANVLWRFVAPIFIQACLGRSRWHRRTKWEDTVDGSKSPSPYLDTPDFPNGTTDITNNEKLQSSQAGALHGIAFQLAAQHASLRDGQDPDVKPLSQPSRPWGLRDLDPSTVGGKRWNSAIILVAQDRHVLALGESYTKPVPL